ncbi:aspartate aminotransferase family protein [Pseudomonadota bacterium]
MNHVFHRMPNDALPTAVSGSGAWLVDDQGQRYLDASGGAAVSCLGHDNERVKRAIVEQVETLSFAHSGFFTTEVMEALADKLCAHAPDELSRVYLLSGGSEANESALKLARQYFLEKGEPNRTHFISRLHSYHGNTLGALAVSGNLGRREPYEPMLSSNVRHIAPCHAYRYQRDDETPQQYGLRVANELETAILALGAENVAAFIAETVVGATMGAVGPVPGYFKRIREICDQYGVLLILDEVMCGAGRTGTMFSFEQDGIVPDMVSMAKGLGGGYQPVGAVLASNDIYTAITSGSGFFRHGHTYMGHATVCAAALAVLSEIEDGNLLANVQAQGAALNTALLEAFGQHPHVGDVRGRGLFQAIELVRDRDGKLPFDTADRLYARIKKQAMKRGLICYPMGGTADGHNGDHVLLAPPYIVTADDVGEMVGRLSGAVDDALREILA